MSRGPQLLRVAFANRRLRIVSREVIGGEILVECRRGHRFSVDGQHQRKVTCHRCNAHSHLVRVR